MTQKTTTALVAEIQQLIASNANGNITAAVLQSVLIDITQSALNILTNGGLSTTITTAKLTPGGTNGSMTYSSGILTAQVAAT